MNFGIDVAFFRIDSFRFFVLAISLVLLAPWESITTQIPLGTAFRIDWNHQFWPFNPFNPLPTTTVSLQMLWHICKIIWHVTSGDRMGIGKKVWKVRNAKLAGGCTPNVKGILHGMVSLQGGLGVVPQKIFGSFCPNTHTPHPWKIFSSDLHWSQGWSWELEKKVWRFCPLYLHINCLSCHLINLVWKSIWNR